LFLTVKPIKIGRLVNMLLLEYGASPDGIPIDMKTPPALQSLIERFRAEFQLKKLIPDTRVYVTRDLTMGKERYPITVENDVGDGAVLDEDFEYASTVLDLDVFRCRIDFSLACCCVDNCQSHCPCVSRCVYDSSGRLTDKVREMAERQELGVVLECNASCFCSSQCPSRVAQSGVRSHLEVYRSRRYGWAVRSTVPIQKGEFISEYTGELISGEEADKREDDTYLFEIVDDAASYCIDAKRRGNVSRFINHSCEANLMVVRVVWDANVRHFPHICFFAKKNISRGEELTIDYGKQWWDVKLMKFLCQCGSKRCKYGEEARAKLLQENCT
uniref:SET domain-containing protein n=1 Tax=Parascaris univalens TaxID=6257 RepID=A0A915AYG5_PARUN